MVGVAEGDPTGDGVTERVGVRVGMPVVVPEEVGTTEAGTEGVAFCGDSSEAQRPKLIGTRNSRTTVFLKNRCAAMT